MNWIARFTVLAVLCAGSTIAAAATAQAAEFRIGVQDARPISHNAGEQQTSLDTMRGLGADMTRLTLFWQHVADKCDGRAVERLANPNDRCYDWRHIDRAVRLANERGLEVLVSVYGAPRWANGSDDIAWTGGSEAEFTAFATQYAAFARAAAARYSQGGSHGFVRYWTVWNEPNSGHFWKPTGADAPSRYARLYALTAPAMKATSPSSLVAPGPTGSNSTVKPGLWIPRVQAELAALGAGASVDAWAHNPYPGGNFTPFRQVYRMPAIGIGNIGDLVTLMDSSDVTRGKPIWATEFAYQTNPPDTAVGASFADQAKWLGEALDVAWSTGRMPIFEWYIMQDSTTAPELDWDSGLFEAGGAEKPSAAMFRRPISVGVLADGRVRVWGMSSIDPAGAELVMAPIGTDAWTALPAVRYDDGVRVLAFTAPPGHVVAVRDGSGIGPVRSLDEAPASPVVAGGSKKPARATKATLKLRQVAPRTRRAATCGAAARRACIYRRKAAPSLHLAATQRMRLFTLVVFERRTAKGWRRAYVLPRTMRQGTASIALPKRVRTVPGVWRARAQPASASAGSASTSAWQYMRLR